MHPANFLGISLMMLPILSVAQIPSSVFSQSTDRANIVPLPAPAPAPSPAPSPANVAQARRGSTVSLNPQPLPPKALATGTATLNAFGGTRSLNPQPLPPKESATGTATLNALGGTRSLNPQPLPPKTLAAGAMGTPAAIAATVAAAHQGSATAPATRKAARLPNGLFQMPDSQMITVDGKPIAAGVLKKAIVAHIDANAAPPTTVKVQTRHLNVAAVMHGVAAGTAGTAPTQLLTRTTALPTSLDSKSRELPVVQNFAERVASTRGVSGIGALMCNDNGPPRIDEIKGKMRPGQSLTIDGTCLGNRAGRVEIIGPFPGGKLVPAFTAWDMTGIVLQIPATIRGATDGAVAVSVITADGKVTPARMAQFVAVRERVDVPERRWSPAPGFDLADAIDATPSTNKAYAGHLAKSLQINPQCALDSMDAVVLAGSVTQIRGFEDGPANEASIMIDWNGACTGGTIKSFAVAGGDIAVVNACHVSFYTRAWAYCPAGVAP